MAVTEENYHEYAERVYATYKDRIVKTLDGLKQVFAENLWDYTAPFDMSGDDYEWGMLVAPHGESARGERAFYIAFQMRESMAYEGDPTGVTFAIDVTYHGGYIVGGLTPYNYTDQCWVPIDDEDEVEERFSIVENCDAIALYNLCADWTPPKE